MNSRSVTAFAPATVANVGCGFDIMGFAVKGIGDKVTITLRDDKDTSIIRMSGFYGNMIPTERNKNTAGVAIDAYLKATGRTDLMLDIFLEKNLPLGSGLGSSASSAAAAIFALNNLLGNPLTTTELIPFAMEGERIACGSAHADNVAPSLLGGFVLIRSYQPLDIIRVKCPDELCCTIIHPHIQLKTSDARRILKRDIPINDAIRQSANAAAFMTGMINEDFDLMGRSICDLLAEPKRTQLIPGFEKTRQTALDNGAIGCGISGSGPSVFALCKGELIGGLVAEAMKKTFYEAGLNSDTFVSRLNAPGASILQTN
jgi:homoserine kinase